MDLQSRLLIHEQDHFITQKVLRKAISPVIATIILMVVAQVLALIVGVFAFGLFSSQTKSVSLQWGKVSSPSVHSLGFDIGIDDHCHYRTEE